MIKLLSLVHKWLWWRGGAAATKRAQESNAKLARDLANILGWGWVVVKVVWMREDLGRIRSREVLKYHLG